MKASRILAVVGVLALALGVGLYAYVQNQKPLLELGVGYAARVGCGCRYIGNRPLEDCYKDFEPGMELIRLSEDTKARSVTASVRGLVSRTARFDKELGCQPEPYRD